MDASVEKWHAKTLAEAACASLVKNGFDAQYAEDAEAAAVLVESFIRKGSTVGIGGSMTLKKLGIAERAERLGAVLLDHSKKGLSQDEKMEVMRAQLSGPFRRTSRSRSTESCSTSTATATALRRSLSVRAKPWLLQARTRSCGTSPKPRSGSGRKPRR